MYYIEMFVEVGEWSVRRMGDRKFASPSPLRHTSYEWMTASGGSWSRVGGVHATWDEAYETMGEYVEAGSSAKPKWFRIRQL